MGTRPSDGGISPELDQLGQELLGLALDRLAGGGEVLAVAEAMDAGGTRVTCEFEDDGPEACIAAAREWVRRLDRTGGDEASGVGTPRCYAIVYEGAVADERDAYQDALILEFGEKGALSGYSAFVLVNGVGLGEGFSWSDPEPAGEVPLLL
ncbi:MAG: hypothetical protein PHR15_02700 [Atopobiaceae bacterium]|jgi:hypothetical protein|nr:hypothetical protein [Atopobiaceae bacterium]MCH4181086.1 hypothetical protein [Atopobiaceae bacterium]MCH4214115.1 hypothetical protein [Atopobiaceae bacterium]MCH4230474.1 hypothetical protein [Atopobiaceae bacterium]MCH4276467.1 hypothetical protein [Atopobiaceae bacterium]